MLRRALTAALPCDRSALGQSRPIAAVKAMTTLNKNLLVLDAAAEGGYRAATLEEILDAVRWALANRVEKSTALTSPKLHRTT